MDLPGQTIFVSKPLSPTSNSTLSPELQTQSNLPGMPGYVGTIRISEDDKIPDENDTRDSVEGIKDYDEEPSVDPAIPSSSPTRPVSLKRRR